MPTSSSILLPLLIISAALRPSSPASAVHHHRRILHQPFLPQDSFPPSPPPTPSPPKYPFTSSTPDNNNNNNNSPFFPSYPSPPPPPPSPASFASFPANISSLTVPRPSKPTSASSKLIAAAVAAVIAAVVVVSLAVFLHLRKRTRPHRSSSSFSESKTQRSDAVSFNQNTPHTHHIPKLQRPSQTSAEFLYLGTLVNSHPIGSSTSTTNHVNASNPRKLDSPELRPLPPLSTQQQNFRNNAAVVLSRDDESEEFYSPKGSVNGKESSIGTGSASARAFAAIEMENFNGSTSNSSSAYSSSVPPSDSGSPVRSVSLSPRNSMPKSPDLIEIQTNPPLPPQMPSPPDTRSLLLQESASPSPPTSSSSPERYPRSEVSSPRISNVSNQNTESPVRISSPVPPNTTIIPTPPEIRASVLPESPPRILNASDQIVGSPVSCSSPVHHNTTIVIPTPPEMQVLVVQELASQSPERYLNILDRNVESPVRISSPKSPESASPLPPNSSSPERYFRSEKSSPRISNVSDQNVDSMVRISSPAQLTLQLSTSSLLLEGYSRSEECSPRTSNASDDNVESPTRISSPLQHKTTVIPTPPPPPPQPILVPPPPPVSVPPPPPPPPPPPLSKVWESPRTPTPTAKKPIEPPALRKPLTPIAFESPILISPIELPSNDSQTAENDGDKESSNKESECSSEDVERNEESTPKPKLKPLHWDKVRASSDREMVWDQLKCSSFKLNEEMIESLFVANAPKPNPNETTRWQVLPSPGQDNGDRVLEPKKAQNIAILLKALHVTVDEVCDGLLEGNTDILGTDLLESLLKMAPTKEEERKLKEYKDESPVKLGAAERFLKAVVDVPYAFKRVEAMLYISNFDSEVEYLKKSFSTLEAACEELRTSRMFLKLLEAVLKTGNRMNVGTNRGDAHAFKLDTLLKLVDVKGADGKTTLLHFVVQEIIRSEGARLSDVGPHENPSINDDAKCRKLGLQVVSSLSSELSNVKKAAVMDAEVLISDVSKLSKGNEYIKEIVALNEAMPLEESGSHKFSDSMNSFMRKAEEEVFRIQAQESLALSLVKEITEYFHGNSAKEEAHPFRIFMVVRDFLTILDRVCKEVGMINERTMVSSAHKFPVPVNPMLQLSGVFHRQHTSSDDESLPFIV